MTVGALGPVVGHAAPLRRARDIVDAGLGGLLLITGPAGIGKTTLARRLSEMSAMPVAWAVGGRADAPAFWPWTQLLRHIGTGESRRLASLVDPAADSVPPPIVEDVRERFALFDDVAARLDAIGPHLLVIDDLHHADTASLLLLAHVAARLPLTRVRIAATVRDDVPTPPDPWASVWPELIRSGELITVGPLSVEDVQTLLASSSAVVHNRPAAGDATRDTAQRIVARTGGNAFFVRELVRALADNSADTALPEGARAVVSGRVAELGASARTVLSAASVIGVRFSPAQVAIVVGEPADVLDPALDEAAAAGLVIQEDVAQYAFAHEIVRDAIHDALARAHREHWHAQIAQHLVDTGGSPGDIAHHLHAAGRTHLDEAATWSERAGAASMARMAYEDAARHYETAIARTTPAAAPRLGSLHLAAGAAHAASGHADAARARYLAAATLARATSDGTMLADAALGLGAGPAVLEVALNDRDQVDALRDALALLPNGALRLRALVLARLSVALTFAAPEDERAALAAQAIDAARASGDAEAIGTSLAAYCDTIAGPEHCRERLALTTEIVEAAVTARDPMLELLGRRQRLVARLELGDVRGAEDETHAFGAVAAALHQPACAWYAPLWRAGFALLRGEFDRCHELVAEVFAIGERVGSTNASMLGHTLAWVAASESGDGARVEEITNGLREMTDYAGPWVAIALGLAALQQGQVAEAAARANGFAELVPQLPRDSEWLPAISQAAEVVAALGPASTARLIYDAMVPFEDLYIVEGIGAGVRGSVQRFLGMLAAQLGDLDLARMHFDIALERHRRMGAALLVARTLRDYGLAVHDAALIEESGAHYAQLGIGANASQLAARGASFVRTGDTWRVGFAGQEAILRDSKGLRDIAVLLAQPGRPVAAVELAAGSPRGAAAHVEDGLHEQGDLGELVDARAREAYRERLADLDAAIADAEGAGADALHDERDALVAQLAAAYGLGGRPRRAGSPVERARSTVTARIRDGIRKVETVHPELGRHLRNSLRTGTLCVYEPESPVEWTL